VTIKEKLELNQIMKQALSTYLYSKRARLERKTYLNQKRTSSRHTMNI